MLSTVDVVRAWKDERYRLNLSQEELAALPAHPAGQVEMTKDDLLPYKGPALFSGEDCLDTRLICSIVFGCITITIPFREGTRKHLS